MPKSEESSAAEAKSRLHKVFGRNKDDAAKSAVNAQELTSQQDRAVNAEGLTSQQDRAENAEKLTSQQDCAVNAQVLTSQQDRAENAEGLTSQQDCAVNAQELTSQQDRAVNAQDQRVCKGSASSDEIELVECEIVEDLVLDDAKEKSFRHKIAQSTVNLRDHISSGFTKKVKKVKVDKSSDLKDRTEKAVDTDYDADIEVVPDNRALVVVRTKEELHDAQKSGAERILVKGELGKKLHTSFKALRAIGTSSFNTLALVMSGAALFAPFTGGVSLGAAGTVMGTVGAALTATAIAAISAIGLALVIAVFKGYEEVRLGGGGMELVIKKGKKKECDLADEKAANPDDVASGGEKSGDSSAS